MDIGTLRGLVTLTLLVAFVALVISAWSKRRKTEYDELARMPLEDDPSSEDQGSKTP